MDVIIQCAATKDPEAGKLRARDGRDVHFVAAPQLCMTGTKKLYARPDDGSDIPGQTWRDRLVSYVDQEKDNPLGLRHAYMLYKHPAYARLVQTFGASHVFILSAGWGLVRADYLLPAYDVTFNQRAKKKNPAAFCATTDGYRFFQHVSKCGKGPITFLGGRDYLPLFDMLTSSLSRERIAFVRATEPGFLRKNHPRYGFEERDFHVAARTNWHYQCALALAAGTLQV